MRLHRFFIPGKALAETDEVRVSLTDLLHQWRNVFRYNVGSMVILFDETEFEALCQIETLSIFEARLSVLERKESSVRPRREIFLFQSLLKKDKFEWILEKGTELGISHFRPVLAERSEKKGFNLDRARAIIKEAAEQSGRGRVPDVGKILTLEEAVKTVDFPVIAFHGAGKKFSARSANENLGKVLGIMIGSEGGWSDHELNLFEEKGVSVYSLGAATLRAETAALAIATLLLLG